MAIVTFTTDFGLQDGYVGAMKGVVLGHAPAAILVDISHEVPAQDVATGAFILAQAAAHFPPGTIHVAVVDPGVGGERHEIVVAAGGQFFVGPDNGLLSLAAARPSAIHVIENPRFRREPASPTFHGRDVFAPTAGRLAAGARPEEAGPSLSALQPLTGGIQGGSGGEARVLHVDHYGNLITSRPAGPLPPEGLRLELLHTHAGYDLACGRTFIDVAPGELIAYVGSSGFVEIAVRNGSAAAQLGVGRGDMVRLRDKDRPA